MFVVQLQVNDDCGFLHYRPTYQKNTTTDSGFRNLEYFEAQMLVGTLTPIMH